MDVKKSFVWKNKKIDFGMPSSKKEFSEMFRLRYDVYVKEKGYIPNSLEMKELAEDRDQHDENNECHYFIVKCNNKIIGTARMIDSNHLPIEKDYFDFEEPEEFKKISREKIVEIGRLISRPNVLGIDKFPRHLIPLGMFLVISEYGKDNGYYGGYGALKLYAFKKFNKLGFPLKLIKKYKLKYSPQKSNDPLRNFFNPNDPVIPLYFLNEEIVNFYSRLFNSSLIFSKKEKDIYFVKKNLNLLDLIRIRFFL
ncbi:MAG: N-acyl amino acid synthase FeeM domain-containing protein [Patescibacteria group bacterium]